MPSSLVKNLLLTGRPGCGKTTVVRRLIEILGDLNLAGFYTQELRERDKRVGFEIIGLHGKRGVLAHMGGPSKLRVGRYGVELRDLEAILKEEMGLRAKQVNGYIIDEVGKMECFSQDFVTAVRHLLDGSVPVVATVSLKGTGFIAEVKDRPDVQILTVTSGNRDELPAKLALIVQKLG
jgi:nucleoside-triphosphatase